MTLVMMLSAVWFIGDLRGNGHVPLVNTAMANCKAFGFWMRILLGICGVFSLMTLRAYGLYRIFCLRLPYHSLGLYLPFCVYLLFVVAFGVVGQVFPNRVTTQYMSPIDMCNVYSGFQTAMYMFLCVTVSIVMVVHWMIRNIKSSFNESREMVATCAIILANLIFATIMVYAPLKNPYPLDTKLRIIYTSLSHSGVNAMWWLVMAVPMYNCMFNRQRYLVFWITKLRDDGLQREYNVSLDAIAAATTTNPESYLLDKALRRNETRDLYAKGSIYSGRDTDTITRPHIVFFSLPKITGTETMRKHI
ncbi:hypothetical protein LPJ66_002280 [Kickxella alabastrina]|uniref:Uncharacterized protein n=1 Tax=Kickxella alabastrina TaxID=61397 RepID=A0ACC1IQX2_9FUNG|nr:hypothetical protein LPJ66_002280 [Kickxella alabastrina]